MGDTSSVTARLGELRRLLDRSREVVILAAVIGVASGLGVAAFDRITADGLFSWLTSLPGWAEALGPLLGLAMAAAALRWLAGGAGPATADEYIKSVVDPEARFDLRPVPGRLLASMATLGAGAAMGFEGPSIYLGAATGAALHRRLARRFTGGDGRGGGSRLIGIDRHAALVAGAAAGVAAIFKAPATGAVFALEVPYQEDLARRMLLPAMVGAGVSYVTFVSLNATTPLLPIQGAPPFDLRDVGGAVVVGVLGGIGARAF